MILPKRQESQQFELKKTFEPPLYMVILRGIVEFFKITVPPALTSCCFIFSYWFMSEILGPVASLGSYILFCPLVIFGSSVFVSLVTILLKWLLVGRYHQLQKPLWSLFIWKNEFINSLCENLAFPLLLQMIQGTPFLPAFFRLLGCRIGKNVFMETTEITEFDLVFIDDNASLNYGCTIQTHLFEDRVMKMSNLYIGKNTTVGPMSVILYDSSMKNGAVLDGLSLLMKGETLPSSTAWFGIPARSQSNIGN
jgi:non-ribosomal peptide synthetase-like protein